MKKIRTWREDWKQRGESGAAATEFAIVLPVFLALLFGIIQFGSVLFLHNNMVNAARETARRMAVDESFDSTQGEAYAQNYLANWSMTFTVNATAPTPPATGDIDVQISVAAADATLVNFPLTWPGTLVAQATMRPEW